MLKRSSALAASAAFGALSLVWVTGCHLTSTDPAADGGATDAGSAETSTPIEAGANSISCYLATQFLCDEYPNPTPAQVMDVPAACSSGSGDLKQAASTSARISRTRRTSA
jgi:hypothetical protein